MSSYPDNMEAFIRYSSRFSRHVAKSGYGPCALWQRLTPQPQAQAILAAFRVTSWSLAMAGVLFGNV